MFIYICKYVVRVYIQSDPKVSKHRKINRTRKIKFTLNLWKQILILKAIQIVVINGYSKWHLNKARSTLCLIIVLLI